MPQRLPCKFRDAGLEKRLRTHDGGADRRTLDSGSRWSRQAGPPRWPRPAGRADRFQMFRWVSWADRRCP